MDSASVSMRDLFLQRHQEFRCRLRRRLGSEELVNDVMQETYLRVERMGDAGGGMRNPVGYLFRMALNVAVDLRRQSSVRLLSDAEVEDLLHVADDTLDPARVVQGQFELLALEQALAELSPRRREILVASRLEGVSHAELARRFGISERMVGKELKKSLEYCGQRLERKVVQRFGPRVDDES